MGRSPCCSKEGLNRGAWTAKEDMILSDYIRIHGESRWKNLPEKAGLIRCGKSCRLRWRNYLRPGIKRGNITPDEEDLIIRLHRLLGNRWSLIAGRLPERTDNEIKNYWNTYLTKKMLSMAETQHNGTKNLKTGSKSLPLNNHVFKTAPVRVETAVRHPEMVRLKGSHGYGLKFFNVKEVTNSSQSCCNLLLNDAIIADDSYSVAFAAADNLVETEARNCNFSMSSLADKRTPHSHYIAGLPESLLNLDELTPSDSNLLSSLSDSVSEQFSRKTPTLPPETDEFQAMCSDLSIVQGVSIFIDATDQGMEDFFDNTQQVDWIHELDLE